MKQKTQNKTVLLIDTSESNTVVIGLRYKGKTYILRSQKKQRKTQTVLPMIDKLLGKHGLTIFDVRGIEINEGPGSFTGLRVGASIANSLALLLNIPINGYKLGRLIKPRY